MLLDGLQPPLPPTPLDPLQRYKRLQKPWMHLLFRGDGSFLPISLVVFSSSMAPLFSVTKYVPVRIGGLTNE